MRMRSRVLGPLTVLALAVLPLLLAAERPNLRGRWKLNQAQSDDPQQKMREAMGEPGRRPAGPPEGRPAGRGVMMGRMLGAAESVTIEQEGDQLEVEFAEGRPVTLTADGQTHEEEGPRGTVRTTTRWEGDKLISVRDIGVMKITTDYELAGGGTQLIVTRRIEGGRFKNPVVIKSVYDKEQ